MGGRFFVLPKTSTDTPSASRGTGVISQCCGRSSSSNLSRRAVLPAQRPSSMSVVNHRQACFHAQVHAGVFDSLAKVVPARLPELAAEDFLKLLSVDRAYCTAAVQIPVQPEDQVFEWYPLGWRKFPHPLFIDREQESAKGRSDPCRGPLEQNPGVGKLGSAGLAEQRLATVTRDGDGIPGLDSRPEAREGSARSSATQAVEA